MNNDPSHHRLNRRSILKLMAFGGITAVASYGLSEYTPWLDYDERVEETWLAPEKAPGSAEQMRTLIHYATLAANGHNTQPWEFSIKENEIEIHPDYSRQLAVVDPHHRELWISLGCALENLILAAQAGGFAYEVTYPDEADFIRIRLAPDARQSNPLFNAILLRQNTRTEYDGQPVKSADFDQLESLPLEPGVAVQFFTTPADMENVLAYVNQGNLRQYADPAFVDELIFWLRFNKKEALASLDGLYSRCSGNPEVPRWLGKMFVARTRPQQQADADAKKLRSSSGAVVIASESDNKTTWVRTGQVYERLALKMTTLDIKSALLNQPVEVAEIRAQFQQALNLKTSLPQLLMRYGYADATPRSLRRPVEAVIV